MAKDEGRKPEKLAARAARLALTAPERIKTAVRMRTARLHPAPLFVLGNQKAGTTAVAQLLAEATGKTVTHDFLYLLDDRVQEDLFFGRTSLKDFIDRRRLLFARDIIKDNSLTFFYRELKTLFPASKFVMVVRDPRANIRSILSRLELPGDADEIGPKDSAVIRRVLLWRLLLEGKWPPAPGANYIERMAARWNLAADVYLEAAEEMALLRYEDFVKAKSAEIAGLARRVGLQPVNEIGGLVNVQYQPKGAPGASWLEFFGAKNLKRIEDVCLSRMARLDYQRGP